MQGPGTMGSSQIALLHSTRVKTAATAINATSTRISGNSTFAYLCHKPANSENVTSSSTFNVAVVLLRNIAQLEHNVTMATV